MKSTAIAVNPLTEPDTETWQRWSRDRDARQRAAKIEVESKTPTALERADTAREIADAIAADAANLVPDWRLLRTDVVTAYMRIVRQQPEYRQKELQQRESLLRLIEDNLPPHIRPLMRDLATIHELTTLARESAAFLVGHATGRRAGQMHVDSRGRLRGSVRGNRSVNRLGLAEGGA